MEAKRCERCGARNPKPEAGAYDLFDYCAGPTFGMRDGALRESIEGRITQADFDALLDMLNRVRNAERERCAGLHEQVDPASDSERLEHIPGAGAMGAVIEYRDLIRSV